MTVPIQTNKDALETWLADFLPATLRLGSADGRLLPAQITNLKNRCTAMRSRIEKG